MHANDSTLDGPAGEPARGGTARHGSRHAVGDGMSNSRQDDERRWALSAIDAYRPVVGDWAVCPRCHVQPRAWVFNNGEYARCQCPNSPYRDSQHTVSAIAAMSVFRRDGSVGGYDPDLLRRTWNQHVELLAEVTT